MAEPMTWIALGYRLSALPSRNRVYVWRRLKDLGAVYFESGVALLPMQADMTARMEELRADILRFGGHATLASMRLLRPEDDSALILRFNEAVRAEYDEVGQIFRRLADACRAAGEGRHPALCPDGLLTSLRRAGRMWEKIREKDYFRSPAGLEAETAYREAAARVEEYAAVRHGGRRQGVGPDPL